MNTQPSATASPGPSPGGVPTSDSFPPKAASGFGSRGGQAAVARSAGVHDPAHAGAVAEGRSLGGQATLAARAGVHDPAHAGAVAEWASLGGQAAVARSAGVHERKKDLRPSPGVR
jgi:hypothetical protein